MPLIVPTPSEESMLDCILNVVAPANLTLKLFVNDYTPVATTVVGDLTEMTTQGYVAKTLVMANWDSGAGSPGPSAAAYPEQTFTFDGTGGSTTVYGYYVVNSLGDLMWVERFATARVVTTNGDLLIFTPTLTLNYTGSQIVLPISSEELFLEYLFGSSTPDDLDLRLYVNNYTAIDTSVVGDFTEMSTQGYAAKALASASWNTAAGTAGDSKAAYPEQTFTFDGTGGATTVYGYILTDALGDLMWAEKFVTPRVVTLNGDQIILTPQVKLNSL